MVDLHLVLPALNFSTLDAGWNFDNETTMQQVRFMMLTLNMVDSSMSTLIFLFDGQVEGPFMILVSDPVPLGLMWVLNCVGLGWGWA